MLSVGTKVKATTTVNIRQGPGLGYPVIGSFTPIDEVQEIIGAPVDADYLTWYPVKGGWVADSFNGQRYIVPEAESPQTLVQQLSERYGIDRKRIGAVIQVESGGRGFHGGRLLIRFEPHIFRVRTAKKNDVGVFFKTGDPSWHGEQHYLRTSPTSAWTGFHGDQEREWLAVALASAIDGNAAWEACSMGAPQLMGFNHEMLGYSSAGAMMVALSESVNVQISAMFRFMDTNGALAALRDGDYYRFATIYNGYGQAQRYAQLIKQMVANG